MGKINTASMPNPLSLSDVGGEPLDTDARHYAQQGYVILRRLVPQEAIDALLDQYQKKVVTSRDPFFRQNTNRYEPNKLTSHGHVKQSFLDIHDYGRYPEFSQAARDIYCAPYMLAALRRVCGFNNFALMQTMLFDMNTETPAHQDWYYLDSVPNGNLTAAWIALENIDERAGRFYVLPGSQTNDFGAKTPGRTHAQWLENIRTYIDEHRGEVVAHALRRGDVLLWNSRTVHGSLPTQDIAFSRKSLTAHYLPDGFEFGNMFSVKRNLVFKEHSGVRYYRNQPDFSHWNRLKFFVKTRAYNYPRLRETLRSARDVFIRRRAG